MIKNKKIIAALCAATVVVTGISIPAAADTTGSGYTYGQSSEGTVTTKDGKEVTVSIGNTYGATEDQKNIYRNFASYLDTLVEEGSLNEGTAALIKADAAYIIANGGNPTDDNYYLNNPDLDYDATLVININKNYDSNTNYVSSASTANKIEEVLVNTSAGSGTVSKQEVTSTVIQALEVQSTDQNAALLEALFLNQSARSVQAAINSGTLNTESANILNQVAGTNSSINGVIYGNETLNEFCQTRNLSYQDAINYIIALGSMEPSEVPARDRELASAVNNLFNVSDGAAHEAIVNNMVAVMDESNKELAAAQAYLRQLVVTEVYEKNTLTIVNEDAGTGITQLYNELMSLNTIGEGTKYIENVAYSHKTYFNEKNYDGQKLMNSLQIMFPGYDLSGYYESYVNAQPPFPEDFDQQLTKMLQEIQNDYYGNSGGKGDYTYIPLYGGCKPESFLITTKNVAGATSEITTAVAASKEIHRTVDTMVFELQRFDGLPIMEEERAKTDAEIFASLYNMYFTPEVRAQDANSDSMFMILDAYMQLHAQVYGTVGMPPITTEYKSDTMIFTIDFESGIRDLAAAIGITYEDFARNFFSYYVRPTDVEWRLDPSQHTYDFYPQETETNYIPSLTQINQTTGMLEPYYIGTVHSKSEVRGNPIFNQIFSNSGGVLRGIGYTRYGETINDAYLKTDSVRPLLLTLRPELSSLYNVHVYVTGSTFEDLPAWKNAATNDFSEGKAWYFYPYREVFLPEGGQYFSGANYSEQWESLRDGTTTSSVQQKITLQKGSEMLVKSIIEENNKQFATNRGDIAAYYNYVVYNGINTSSMPDAYSNGIYEWIDSKTTDFEEFNAGGITLRIPKDVNGEPIYNVTTAITKCKAGRGGGGGSSSGGYSSDKYQGSLGSVLIGYDAYNDVDNVLSQLGDSIINTEQMMSALNSTLGTTFTASDFNVTDSGLGGAGQLYGLIDAINGTSQFGQMIQNNLASSGETSASETVEGDASGGTTPTVPEKPRRRHGNEGDPWPDSCEYYPQCCTRYFIARWNTNALVPAVVMDDIAPTNGADFIAESYEQERTLSFPKIGDDSVFHWRWSQTLEGDPSRTTTAFKTTEGTLPTAQDPNIDPDPENPSSPQNPNNNPNGNNSNNNPNNPNDNPDETTYRTTGSDLPPFPTPITIPSDEPNGGRVVIEQFISK